MKETEFSTNFENRDTIFDEEDEKIPFRMSLIAQKKDIIDTLQHQSTFWVISCRYSKY